MAMSPASLTTVDPSFTAPIDTVDTSSRVAQRLTFGRPSAELAAWSSSTSVDVVHSLLAESPLDVEAPDLDGDSDYWEPIDWWIDVLRRPDTGVHDRMVWFWHGHLTSGLDKSGPARMMRQHELLRTHALGNFRALLQEITLDPAMLGWLDGNGSRADSPNENYGREVMELFALGRMSGAYTERDVRAGAKALAGWYVNDDDSVEFDPDAGLRRSVEFLGAKVKTATDVIDAICDQPACAPYVADAVHRSFVGRPAGPERLDELATVFRDGGLEIAPLVISIVTHETFTDDSSLRPRSPLEWFLAVERLMDVRLDSWSLELLGQMPMNPPNAAGWPDANAWISSGAVLTKARIALDSCWDTATLDATDPVGDIVGRAGLVTLGADSLGVLHDVARRADGRREVSSLLHATVAMLPEFSLT